MRKKRLAYKAAKKIIRTAFWAGRMREKATPRMIRKRSSTWLPALGAGFGGGLGGGLGAGQYNKNHRR